MGLHFGATLYELQAIATPAERHSIRTGRQAPEKASIAGNHGYDPVLNRPVVALMAALEEALARIYRLKHS